MTADGLLKWEKLLPTLPIFQSQFGAIATLSDDEFLFTQSHENHAELFKMDRNGELKIRRNFLENISLIKSSDGSALKNIQLIGFSEKNDKNPVIIDLDESLNEIRRFSGQFPGNFIPYITYKLKDNSIITFGSKVNSPIFGALKITSRAIHFGISMKNQNVIDFIDGHYSDSGVIKVAIPLNQGGDASDFIAVRPLLEHVGDELAPSGIAIDFIKLSKGIE